MTAETIALVISIVGGISGITSIIAFVTSRKQKQRDDGAKEARINASLETIKLQNESLLQGNHQITTKLDGQNIRLSRIEQIAEDADLATIPPKIAALEASVKSAHHRIDGIERKQ